ncbi:uncharacterized protein MEPE_02205 [Melanopsichium pennsylvanicum]|uniref:Uncharacterized protein n=1 Tax=Melanopsichium pennsylvanicum TaxID=63383 RepID=A0AAJ4XLY0_9BASI|nr:uncharacterized protein MEPE_02205 [Melanopsichium pennsylvanicum]
MMKLFTLFVAMLWLMSEVSYAIPEMMPVAEMGNFPDARRLWHTVTITERFPGHGHDVNMDVGVTPEWKDFLAYSGQSKLGDALQVRMGPRAQLRIANEADQQLRAVEIRFRDFLLYRNAVLQLQEPKDQYIARHIVNAYVLQRDSDMQRARNRGMLRAAAAARAGVRVPVNVERENVEEPSVNGPRGSPAASERSVNSYWPRIL